MVISAGIIFLRYSCTVLKCRKVCERRCVVYSTWLSLSIYVCVGVYERREMYCQRAEHKNSFLGIFVHAVTLRKC